jgi:hypothetical protein
MSRPLLLLIALAGLLLAVELGVPAWRRAGLEPSAAPVFYWREATLLTSAPPPFGPALEMYRADRGAELTKNLPEGRKMTLFYFEWDSIELGPFSDVGGHEAEVCNVRHGSFKLLQSGGQRTYKAANGETLRFNYTLLAQPNGNPVYVYKMPWIQGYGLLESLTQDRATRLQTAFLRHRGAARVLEAGFFGATSEDEAWLLFQHEVLDKLQWENR